MARRRGKKTAFAAREFIGDTGGDYNLGGSLGGSTDDGTSNWNSGGSQLDGGVDGWGFDGGGYAGDGTDTGYGDPGPDWGGLGDGGYNNGYNSLGNNLGLGGYNSLGSSMTSLGGFSPTDGHVSIEEAMARWNANPANQMQAPAAPQGMFGPRMGVGTGYLSAPTGLSSPLKAGALSQMFSSQPEPKMQDQVPQDQYGVMSGTVPNAMPNVPQSPVMARNPYDVAMGQPSIPDAMGQIGGATFGGFTALPGQVPSIANQTAYKSPDIPAGVGTTPSQNPFSQYASQGLPPGYADAYGIGSPATMVAGDPRVNMAPGAYQNTQDITMASAGPVNGPETPNQPGDLDYTPPDMAGGYPADAAPSQDTSFPNSISETKSRVASLFGGLGGAGAMIRPHGGEGNNNNNYGLGDPDPYAKNDKKKKKDDPPPDDKKKRRKGPPGSNTRKIAWNYPDLLRTPYRVLKYS